jgi:hypothetical protein
MGEHRQRGELERVDSGGQQRASFDCILRFASLQRQRPTVQVYFLRCFRDLVPHLYRSPVVTPKIPSPKNASNKVRI